jgi:hypothetical protein
MDALMVYFTTLKYKLRTNIFFGTVVGDEEMNLFPGKNDIDTLFL